MLTGLEWEILNLMYEKTPCRVDELTFALWCNEDTLRMKRVTSTLTEFKARGLVEIDDDGLYRKTDKGVKETTRGRR